MKDMTLNRLVKNPAGDSPDTFGNKKLREHFLTEFNQYMHSKGTGVKFEYLRINKLQFVRLVLPSANIDATRDYDVVFKIFYDEKTPLGDRSIQVFSNVPSFTYTYAKVFKDKKYLINEMINLYPDKVFTSSTGYRNRLMTEEAPKGFLDKVKTLTGMQTKGAIWFDRYLFYAAQFVLTNAMLREDANYNIINNVKDLNRLIVEPVRSIEYISSERRVETANRKLEDKQIFRGSQERGYKEVRKTTGSNNTTRSGVTSASKSARVSTKVNKVKRIGKR